MFKSSQGKIQAFGVHKTLPAGIVGGTPFGLLGSWEFYFSNCKFQIPYYIFSDLNLLLIGVVYVDLRGSELYVVV